MTYDETVYTVKVVVTPNADGTKSIALSTKTNAEGAEYTAVSGKTVTLGFENSYNESDKAEIRITKTFNNWNKVSTGFDFTLTGLNGAPMPEGAEGNTVTVNATTAAAVGFGEIE